MATFEVGESVKAPWSEDGERYDAVVVAVVSDAEIRVRFTEDGVKEVVPVESVQKLAKRAKKAPKPLYSATTAVEEEPPVPPLRETQALAVTTQRAMAPYGGWFAGLDVSRMRPRPRLVSDQEPVQIRLVLADAAQSAGAASVVEILRYNRCDLVAESALGDLGLRPESKRIVYDVPGCKIVGDKVVAPAYFDSIEFDRLNEILDKVDKLGLEGALKVCRCLQREAAALVAWIDDDEALTGKHDLLRCVHGEVFRKDRVKVRMPNALFRLRRSLGTKELYRDKAQVDFNLVEDLSAKTGVRFGVELIAATPSPRRRGWARDGFVSHRSKLQFLTCRRLCQGQRPVLWKCRRPTRTSRAAMFMGWGCAGAPTPVDALLRSCSRRTGRRSSFALTRAIFSRSIPLWRRPTI